MSDPTVNKAWEKCSGSRRVRGFSRLIEAIEDYPTSSPLPEEHASCFHAMAADCQRLLKSLSLALEPPRSAQNPVEDVDTPPSPAPTVATPRNPAIPCDVAPQRSATPLRRSGENIARLSEETEELAFSYSRPSLHQAFAQSPERSNDALRALSDTRDPPARIRAYKHDARLFNSELSSDCVTPTDPNEVCQPAPPLKSSSRRKAISRPYTPAPVTPIVPPPQQVPILHQIPSQVSNVASRQLRLLKSMNDMHKPSDGSVPGQVPVIPRTTFHMTPLFIDHTLHMGPEEIAHPLRTRLGEIIRFYDSYMTIGGNQNMVIPYLRPGDIPSPGSYMMHRPMRKDEHELRTTIMMGQYSVYHFNDDSLLIKPPLS
ncbi:uncharacterized protein EI90DRAFT_635909 [Cantharellus anzutake]|uniref:uncharacterized protein n=1 Tax=Cantharellus anzutake TaxID=1750568 RepID=UPI001906E741|nr:uncharacterized protein EI90DRAFT_635909 [Cantharellus anzutake]KAF8333161.1 hypothetical protein EI90DRAFT_635909 [Cantharellus anzutake]